MRYKWGEALTHCVVIRLIKRYDNRKLYDTHARSYVSLDHLASLIRHGDEIRVLDNSSGQDITAQTLTRLIAESSPRALPCDLLHLLVRSSGSLMSATASELAHGLDALVLASLERLGPIRQIRQDMELLRERIALLERLTAELLAALDPSPTGAERHE